MRMGQIKRLCLSSGTFVIINRAGEYWLSDGFAAYRMPGDVEITREMLTAMLDLTQKQADGCSWQLKEGKGINLADNDPEDVWLNEYSVSLIVNGDKLELLQSEDKHIALTVDGSRLQPFAKYNDVAYFARPSGQGWAIAVKQGYQLIAYIMPYRIRANGAKTVVREALEVIEAAMRAPVDPETGEICEGDEQ